MYSQQWLCPTTTNTIVAPDDLTEIRLDLAKMDYSIDEILERDFGCSVTWAELVDTFDYIIIFRQALFFIFLLMCLNVPEYAMLRLIQWFLNHFRCEYGTS